MRGRAATQDERDERIWRTYCDSVAEFPNAQRLAIVKAIAVREELQPRRVWAILAEMAAKGFEVPYAKPRDRYANNKENGAEVQQADGRQGAAG